MAGWLDSFVNLLSGLGVSGRDKAAAQQYANTLLTQPQLELAYRGDWIARKVVDIPANDSTRAWRSWEADEGDIEALEDAEKGLKLQNKLQYAMKRARLYGGAAMILGVDVGKPEEELNVELVTTDSLKFVHVATRYELTAGEVERDLMSPWFGQPKYYERNMGVVSAPYVRIHPSRVIRFVGSEYPDPWQAPDAWGDSVLQTVDDAIKAAGIVTGSIATLISEAKVDVIKTPGLTEALSTVDGTDRLTKRFSYANTSKSIVNALILDSEEEWQRMNATFTGMPDVLQMYLLIASGAADIPATRMLGQSPAGMNATGESDIRNYYDRIKSDQVTQLQPSLAMLDEVLIRSALGTRDPSIHYSWNSLWQLDNVAKAELENKRASTYKIDVDAGLIPIDIMRKARENQLMEDGTYPGLELIIEEYERDVGEQGDAPDQQQLIAPPPVPVIGPGGKPIPGQKALPAPAAKPVGKVVAKTPPKAPPTNARRKSKADALVNDAEPRTLYVRRDVVNTKDIIDWARSQGFKSMLPGAELHVTIAYSRLAVDWTKIVYEAWDQDKDGLVHVPPGGVRLLEKFGEGAIVLVFTSSSLAYRHCAIKELTGATWDYADYQPHVTITYESDFDEQDLRAMEPYRGPIVLGPEIFEEVQGYEGGSTNEVVLDAWTEDERQRAMLEEDGNPDQPRAANGQWGSGGTSVPIDKLKTSQLASETDKETVKSYREKIRNGEKLKPIEVVKVKDTGNYHILDGHHRLAAAKAEHLKTVNVRVAVTVKTPREATEYIRGARFG
jgi:phage-related protein (TIGR01555 family)